MFQPLNRWLLVAAMMGVSLFESRRCEAQRQMESLGRGVIAVRAEKENSDVFISWRLLGTDPPDIAFNVYRAADGGEPVRLNREPIAGPTNVIDDQANFAERNAWFVRPVVKGREQAPSRRFEMAADSAAKPYLSIPIDTPTGYHPNDASVGDLDGDGEYEIVVHQVGRGRDNSQDGVTTEPIFDAYRMDGTRLWRINLGKNIREGAHYTQFIVYDLDGDGRAEFACKTADGTVDGQGHVIGDATADYRNERGRVLEGPEFLTVFNGLTGGAVATVDYLPPRGNVTAWGDANGNRCDRYLACVAYLDGKRPSLVMCRGYYTRTVLAAWNWRGGHLKHLWTFDSDHSAPGNDAYRGQGNHGISVGDVDADGRDEIVYGSCVIDDNGRGLYSTGYGHGDAMHFTDIDPDRPGLEVFKANGDTQNRAGIQLRDARTGEQIFGVPSTHSGGMGRAVAADIDPRHRGLEMWAYDIDKRPRGSLWLAGRRRRASGDSPQPNEAARFTAPERPNTPSETTESLQRSAASGGGATGLYDVHGQRISMAMPRSCNMCIWWDGDLLRELLDGVRVSKWDYKNEREIVLLNGRDHDCVSNNGSKSNPCLCADILGDWREEIIGRSSDNNELRIFTTAIPAERRMTTLMHDPIYRLAIAWQNVAYNQSAHPGFYLGHGMTKPPRPNIVTARFDSVDSHD